MEGVQSFEQRSASDWDGSRGNRVIIANRREPGLRWLTTNDAGRGSWCCSTSLWCCLGTCKHVDEPEKSVSGWNRARRRTSELPPSISSSITTAKHPSLSHAHSGPSLDFGPFASNEWITSKYTIINFLPKNLFGQFRRLANFYFLISAILQIVIPFSPVGPSTSLIPLLFVVSTTAIKQAYEDYLRHKLDNQVNERTCYILKEDKSLMKACSKDIHVGDIVYVQNNQEIPCDMILLASSGSGDRCYITTANLDGETSLKSRTCFQIHQQIGNIDQLNESLLVVECEKPNATLYEFNGFLRAPKDAKAYELLMKDVRHLDDLRADDSGSLASARSADSSHSLGSSSNLHRKRLSVISTIFKKLKQANLHSRIAKHLASEQAKSGSGSSSGGGGGGGVGAATNTVAAERLVDSVSDHVEIPLDISNLLLRASRLRNTDHIFGLAVYTGADTRLAHNSHVKPNKFSSLESRVNRFLAIAFAVLILLSLVSSLDYSKTNKMSAEFRKKYDSPFKIFAAQFMLYNYLVPISLYVTLEFVKFLGTISVLEDKKLKAAVWTSVSNTDDEQIRSPVEQQAADESSSSTTISSKLRKVKHLVGPQCNSSDLNEDLGQVEVLFSDKTGTLTENKMHFMACSINGRLLRVISSQLYEQPEGLCSLPALNVASKLVKIKGNRYAAIASELNEQHGAKSAPRSTNTSGSRSSKSSLDRLAKLPANQRPFDHRHNPSVRELELIDNLEHSQHVAEFFLHLCLCSTITINEQTPLEECLSDNHLEHNDYQSASPDEESLISAAALFGVIICKSSERECFMAIRRRPRSPANKLASTKSTNSQPGDDKKLPSKGSSSSNRRTKQDELRFKPVCETKLSTEKYIVRHFERLITFEFNSTRKKMSVLYRDVDNDCLMLITKGSESVLDCIAIHENMSTSQEKSINSIMAHFEAFSKSGLRTMLVARRFMDKADYEKIVVEMRDVKLMSSHESRNEKLAALYKRVECNMTLVGATAVEDCLQSGVPETIADLRDAGIKVWLLTGDKVETAISVAYLCKLLDRNMNLLSLIRQQDSKTCVELLKSYAQRVKWIMTHGDDQENEMELAMASSAKESVSQRPKSQIGKQGSSSPAGVTSKLNGPPAPGSTLATSRSSIVSSDHDLPRFALVADGRSLHYAMKHAKQELEYVSSHCVCVLGCRLSPLQKAEIVALIKNGQSGPITAAIGDGANDVSMIQEAHVGIGISGKEGRQAVNSSDFAVNRFYMLNRLFFVHGHLFYHRTANTIHYFFYKSFLFIIPQFIYSFYNLSAAASLYHPTMLISYNMIFTSLPVLLYGLTEVSIPEPLLESRPRLYKINRHNHKMRYQVYLSWLLMGLIQSTLAFYSIFLVWGSHSDFLEPGNTSGHLGWSLILFFTIVLLATMKLYFISRKRSWYFDLASFISCCLLPITFYLLSLIDLSYLFKDTTLHGRVGSLLGDPMFWLATLGATAAGIIPDIIMFTRGLVAYYRTINSVIDSS